MPTEPGLPQRQELFGLFFDQLTIEEVITRLQMVDCVSRYSYLVTPNVDHLVRLDRLPEGDPGGRQVLAAYKAASLCVCDSRVLARLAGMVGIRLSVVPGSDLTAKLFKSVVRAGDRIAVIGGDQSMLMVLQQSYPAVEFVQHIPPMGVRHNEGAMNEAAAFATSSGARFILLAIGSPQQELLAHRISTLTEARGFALCIGAAVEFISGQRKRAPLLLQKMSLEWSYRLASEPQRLWRRYVVDGPRIIPMLIRWRLQQKHASK